MRQRGKGVRLTQRQRLEQDYWLSFCSEKEVTEEERISFFHYDSSGGDIDPSNPILVGKKRYGQFGAMLIESYFAQDGSWPGGVYLVMDYKERQPFGLRPLHEWFGDDAVKRWLAAEEGGVP